MIVEPKVNDLIVAKLRNKNEVRSRIIEVKTSTIIFEHNSSKWRSEIDYDTFKCMVKTGTWILINKKKDIAKYLLRS